MPLLKVPDGVGRLVERKRPVDDWRDLAGLDQLGQVDEEVLGLAIHEADQLLLPPDRSEGCTELPLEPTAAIGLRPRHRR